MPMWLCVTNFRARGRVLLVDDETLLARAYGRVLTAAGYDVVRADDGVEGRAAYDDGAFDVVVTDVHMPRLSGLELAAHVRERHASVPVVLMTASLTQAVKERAAEGAHAILAKPIEHDVLVRAVGEAVRGRAA